MWWYQRKSDATDELRAMERFVYTTRAQTMKERLEHMGEPGNRRAFMIVLVLFVFMHLSGMNVVIFYMEIIVREGMVTSIEPWIVVIIVTGTGIIARFLLPLSFIVAPNPYRSHPRPYKLPNFHLHSFRFRSVPSSRRHYFRMARRLHHRHFRPESPANRLDGWRAGRYGVAGFAFPTIGLRL